MTKAPINIFTLFGSIAVSLILFLSVGLIDQAQATTLNLYCNGTTSNSIEVEYETEDATDANLYLEEDLLLAIGAGDNTGYHTETGLEAGTSYTFELEDGGLTGSVTCVTDEEDPDPDPAGTLTCATTTTDSIEVDYETTDATDAHLFMGSTSILDIGAGDNSGSHTEDDLEEDTTYTFYLRDGDDAGDDLLDSVSCTTDEEDPDPVLSLYCSTSTESSIEVEYDAEGATDAELFFEDDLVLSLGAGDHSGYYTEEDLDAGTSYTFDLEDEGLSASVTCTTDEEDPDPDPVGTLTCATTTTDSIEVDYETTDATDAHLFLGSTSILDIGAGDNSGSHTEDDLEEDTTYTFYLRDGDDASDDLLDSVSCTTDEEDSDPDPVGTLTCATTTTDSIEVDYETTDATNAHLFMGSTEIYDVGSGDESGSHTEDDLEEDTTYTFYLRNGDDTDDDLLDSVSCTTDEEDDDDDPTGFLECDYETEDSIRLYYEAEDVSDAHIFRGSTRIYDVGWGDESGTYTDDDLEEDTTYTFYLRNGDDASDDLLDSVSCTTDEEDDDDDPTGFLECDYETEDSIRLYYEAEDVSDAHIFRGSTRIYDVGWGDESGTYTDDDLEEDTTYTFYLRNGDDTDDDLLDSISCTTDDEEDDDDAEINVTKKVAREGSSTYYNSLDVSPGELLTYSIEVEADDEDLEDVFVRDELSSRIIYEGSLKVDGDSVSGDIEDGIDIGDIDEGESKTVTFDVRVASEDEFLIGTTSITNIANVSADNASLETDSATIHVERESKVTEVVTGITGNSFFDYFLIPLLIASVIFFLFRRQITFYIEKLEKGFLKAKEEII
jgi:hypothetical protein